MERGEPGAAVRNPQVQKGHVFKMSGLYREMLPREGQPSPWTGEFGAEGKVCKHTLHRGTEGCWENLEARST